MISLDSLWDREPPRDEKKRPTRWPIKRMRQGETAYFEGGRHEYRLINSAVGSASGLRGPWFKLWMNGEKGLVYIKRTR